MGRLEIFSIIAAILCCITVEPCLSIESEANVTEELTSDTSTESPYRNINNVIESEFNSTFDDVVTLDDNSTLDDDFITPEFNTTEEPVTLIEQFESLDVNNTFGTGETLDDYDYQEHSEFNSTAGIRLLGGTSVTATGVFPYALYVSATNPAGTTLCTAALITAQYAITAASCVYDATAISVTAETVDGTPGTALAATAILHPKYYTNTQDHDIALLYFQAPYTLSSTIGVINIAYKFNTDESKDLVGKSMRIIGFGAVTSGGATTPLNYQTMNVMTKSRCIREMKKRNIKPAANQECLDTESGTRGGCKPADKGAIVTYKFDSDSQYTLVGVLNYYYFCGSSTPNLFTRIGPYWDLIRKYVAVYDNVG